MYVPEMGDDGWFDASVSQSDAEFAGYAMCAVGGTECESCGGKEFKKHKH